MTLRIRELRVPFGTEGEGLAGRAARALGVRTDRVRDTRIARRSLDARGAPKGRRPSVVLTVDVDLAGEQEEAAVLESRVGRGRCEPAPAPPAPFAILRRRGDVSPVVVGTGPAGLFASLAFVRAGLVPRLLERGRPIEQRGRDVARLWGEGILDPESNVQFGEGGAGTFSDGKLSTRIHDPRVALVLRWLADLGAPPEILVDAKPHVGTDRLRVVLRSLRTALLGGGAEMRFGARVDAFEARGGRLRALVVGGSEIDVETTPVVLATGHSARDTYAALARAGVRLEPKGLAIGVRIEEPQGWVDECHYGKWRQRLPLPPADYSLALRAGSPARAVYTFCMCPGGRVIAAASEPGCLVTNGMSYSRRSGPFANSALVAGVEPADFGGGEEVHDPLAGVRFQRRWEEKAYGVGGGGFQAPAQRAQDFLAGRPSETLPASSYRPGLTPANLADCLPPFVAAALREGLRALDRRLPGSAGPEAILVGVETRTSSPVRIARCEDMQAVGASGLYPAGEGAGWAGGIVSSAVDGMRVAERIIEEGLGR